MSGTSYLPLEKQNSGSSVALSLSASVPGRQHGGIALLDDLFLDSVFSAQEADPFDDEVASYPHYYPCALYRDRF